jgi:hypothetical protein
LDVAPHLIAINMADNPALTPEQERALEATLGTIQRVAMKIVEAPRDRREDAFAIARRNYAEGLRRFGQNPEEGAPRAWLEKVMEGLRLLVAEIERSGGASGGRA